MSLLQSGAYFAVVFPSSVQDCADFGKKNDFLGHWCVHLLILSWKPVLVLLQKLMFPNSVNGVTSSTELPMCGRNSWSGWQGNGVLASFLANDTPSSISQKNGKGAG